MANLTTSEQVALDRFFGLLTSVIRGIGAVTTPIGTWLAALYSSNTDGPYMFRSTLIVGNGSPQATAHLLSGTPRVVIPIVFGVPNTGGAAVSFFTDVQVNSTNCTITALSGVSYWILAIL